MTNARRLVDTWVWCLGLLLGHAACSEAASPASSSPSNGGRPIGSMLAANPAGAPSLSLTRAAAGGTAVPEADGGQSLECYSPDRPANSYVPGAHGCPCAGQQFWCVGGQPTPINLVCAVDHWQSAPDGTTCAAPPPIECESGFVFPTAQACKAAHPDCYPLADGRICGVDPGSCRTSEDCPTQHRGINGEGFVAYSCIKPDDRAHCGPVTGGPAVECTGDSGCGVGKICRKDPTAPTWSASYCAKACGGDADCTPIETCEGSGHCRPRTCAECSPYFSCSNSTCAIPICAQDSDCPNAGYCVNKRCSATLGSCQVSCL